MTHRPTLRLRALALATLLVAVAAPAVTAAEPPVDPRLTYRDPRIVAPRSRLIQGVAGAPITEARPGAAAEDVARHFVSKRLRAPGDFRVVSTVTSAGGVRHATLQQSFDGVPVFLGRVSVAILPDGAILSARVGEIALAPPRPRTDEAPPVLDAPAAALDAARRLLGRSPQESLGPHPTAQPALVAHADAAVRAWRVDVLDGGRAERRVQLLLRASDGLPLRLDPLVFPGVASARVSPRDPSQGFVLMPCADPALAPSVDSPAGWTTGLETVGNNTHVQLDREGDFWPPWGAVATASGDPPSFDFAYTGDPRADSDLALANVFWVINDAHDRFRALGFDEASGACQSDNFGRGGNPNADPVYALVQYASGDGSGLFEGAYFGTGADGGFTYLAVGVFEDASGELRDGALESDLLYHEVAHQLSARLIGDDPACLNGAQPQALSEGWSDFFAAAFTGDPVIGAWTSGLPLGVRSAPVGATGLSLVNLCESGCERFRDGEIWSSLLWDIRARLIQLHGDAPGRELAERLVVESMRFAPCQPTFVDARDAMLLADTALTGGAHRCELWQLFVNRGLGFSAATAGPDDTRPVAGYDMPPECAGGFSLRLSRAEYAPDDDGLAEVVDARPQPGASVTLTASGGDSLTVPLAAVPGGAVLRAPFTLAPGPADPGDGVLQAAAGETVTATYRTATDAARVTDGLMLQLIDHRAYGNWCQMDADDDAVDGWYNLTRFLDPGEAGTIEVTLGNALDDELEDLEMRVTSLGPLVRTLPAGWFRLGDIGPMQGTAPRRFAAQFKATAATSAPAGSLADLRLDFRSRGRSGSLNLRLELGMDYVVERGLSPFDGGTETFDPATSSTVGGWRTSAPRGTIDSWRLEGCSGHLSPGGYHVGEPGCAEYADGQVAANLVSPPIFPVPADAVAYRLQDWSFSVSSDLYTDPGNPFCEADFVGFFLTTDPAGFDYSNAEIVYSGAQRYWRPIYEDTGGWVRQGPFNYSREPQNLVPGADYSAFRFMWVFWGDVYDCGFELLNHGRFSLDDVRFTFDVVRKVPETQACPASCVVSAPLAADPPGPKCPGEPFTLRAQGWEELDCAGQVYFAFAGPGVPPEAGWTTTPETTALGEDGGYYGLYTQCETDPQCNDYRAFVNQSPAPPALGGILPGSLRVRRIGADVELSWLGAAAPASYGIWSARDRTELAAGLPAFTLVGRQDDREGPRGENAWSTDPASLGGALAFLRVAGRDRCSDAPNP